MLFILPELGERKRAVRRPDQDGCSDSIHDVLRSVLVLSKDLRRAVGSYQEGLVGNRRGAFHAR